MKMHLQLSVLWLHINTEAGKRLKYGCVRDKAKSISYFIPQQCWHMLQLKCARSNYKI